MKKISLLLFALLALMVSCTSTALTSNRFKVVVRDSNLAEISNVEIKQNNDTYYLSGDINATSTICLSRGHINIELPNGTVQTVLISPVHAAPKGMPRSVRHQHFSKKIRHPQGEGVIYLKYVEKKALF